MDESWAMGMASMCLWAQLEAVWLATTAGGSLIGQNGLRFRGGYWGGGGGVPPVGYAAPSPSQNHLPEPIVIKPFHPKEEAWEGTGKVLSSCSLNLTHLF